MSYESADYINEFDKNLPAPTDSISEGDIHLRMIKDVLQQSFPNVNEAVNCIHTGPTEPNLHSAGTVWFDTSSGLIKMRDASNLTWLNMAHGAADGVGSTLQKNFYYGTNYQSFSQGTPRLIWAQTYSPLSPTSTLFIEVSGEVGMWTTGEVNTTLIQLKDATPDAEVDISPVIRASGVIHQEYARNFDISTMFSMREMYQNHPATPFDLSFYAWNGYPDDGGGNIDELRITVTEME